MTAIVLRVNGKPVSADVEPRRHLADFLREDLRLTGTHIGCEHGVCGACTVEIDGEIGRSCITYAATCDGAHVRTIEDFDADPLMERLRDAFKRHHALQCGYCTPGMLLTARDLIRRRGDLSEKQVRIEMSGNLCRCTGYQGIIAAVMEVMAERGSITQTDTGRTQLGPWNTVASVQNVHRDETPTTSPAERRVLPRKAVEIAGFDTLPNQDAGNLTKIEHRFVVRYPRLAVWDAMADLEKLAECLPGATLNGPANRDGSFSGAMIAKLGPIKASFAGTGIVKRVDEDFSARIDGQGRDTSSASLARGYVIYRLEEESATATRVEFILAYALSGRLAQFGRAGLVRDLVTRMAETFAENLDRQLSGQKPIAKPLNILGLFWSVVRARLRAIFRW